MKKILTIILSTMTAAFVIGYMTHGYGMGSGMMMGGGMMGGGMMGQSSNNDKAASASVDPKRADELLAYIRKNGLSCTSCHSISGNGVGPSFAAVSASYANTDDAESVLEHHIENGYRRMPGGLASESQARQLAELILNLAKPKAGK